MNETELDEWDEYEEMGCADLEDQLDAALDRAFLNRKPSNSGDEHV